ncbi:hypothetical protein [Streptomyces sp. NPDC014806]|uniref:hypothetical protein n=1 Tax=Streptomyces sp. NPDC014806 TaxID=3364920 RepID=UPI0036FF3F1C
MRNKRWSRRLLVPAVAVALAAVPSQAFAGGGTGAGGAPEGSASATGGAQNGGIQAQTKVTTTVNGGGAQSAKTGTLTPSNSNWTPPACWYEPSFSPKEIEATVKAIRSLDGLPFFGGIGTAVGDMLDYRYKDGNPYKNYNLDQQGKGMFWAAVKNPNRKDDPAANACDKPPFWVPNGQPPNEPLAVSPKVLAEYAYDELPIPGTDVKMAPAGASTVNLPTWIWLDKTKIHKVSVTASLPGTGLSATTTAEPVSLHIDPGTSDAETIPASGDCMFVNGAIGEEYTAGKANQTPPCGVRYLRSTGAGGPYALKATVTWRITWTSTTEPGVHSLPSGTFGDTQNVTVREIQSVNR